MNVVGLDLSTRSCGIARTDGRLVTVKPRAVSKGAGPGELARRLDEIDTAVGNQIHPLTDLAVIEGYSLGGIQGMTMAKLGEVGGVVRLRLWRMGVPMMVVAPKALKSYACDNGNASKAEMVAACVAAGGDPRNDDEADAFWLRRYGMEHG